MDKEDRLMLIIGGLVFLLGLGNSISQRSIWMCKYRVDVIVAVACAVGVLMISLQLIARLARPPLRGMIQLEREKLPNALLSYTTMAVLVTVPMSALTVMFLNEYEGCTSDWVKWTYWAFTGLGTLMAIILGGYIIFTEVRYCWRYRKFKKIENELYSFLKECFRNADDKMYVVRFKQKIPLLDEYFPGSLLVSQMCMHLLIHHISWKLTFEDAENGKNMRCLVCHTGYVRGQTVLILPQFKARNAHLYCFKRIIAGKETKCSKFLKGQITSLGFMITNLCTKNQKEVQYHIPAPKFWGVDLETIDNVEKYQNVLNRIDDLNFLER